MTIALGINAVDSLVFASDSATTQQAQAPDGHVEPINIWNTANKIFNLRRQWPIGAMTWGRASIGGLSIATLAKVLRERLSGLDEAHADWELDRSSYTIEEVADRAVEFFHDEHYAKDPAGVLGLLVGGFTAGEESANWYQIRMEASGATKEQVSPLGAAAMFWEGQPEAIYRLVKGVSGALPQALLNLGAPKDQVIGYVEEIMKQVAVPMVFPGMPVGETIDLADFLVDTTIKFVRFTPGHPTVGGPVEIAAMTRHEGFKWIKRKHHFSAQLNPGGGGGDQASQW